MYKIGDRVQYHAIGGAKNTTFGIIKDIWDEPRSFKGHEVHASHEDPRYLIENEHTKKETPYKLRSIVEKHDYE